MVVGEEFLCVRFVGEILCVQAGEGEAGEFDEVSSVCREVSSTWRAALQVRDVPGWLHVARDCCIRGL